MPAVATKHPVLAVLAAAVLGTVAATYPLFLGYSLVSPWNGPTAQLYDRPPFVYGASASIPEDVRGTDVGAMMWAILPYTKIQRTAIGQGEWPLWNRYNSEGQPLWGQGQTFILDPFHLAALAIPDLALGMDGRFVVGRFVFALGSGLTVLVVTGSAEAGALIALAAPFAGHFTSRFNHPAYFSIVYAPWILLAFAALSRAVTLRDRGKATVLLALATWIQLVGSTPKEGVVAIAVAYLCGVLSILLSPGPMSTRFGRLDAAAFGGVLALLLGAPHWLIFLDTLSRTHTVYDQPGAVFAGPFQTLNYLLGAAVPGQRLTGGHALLTLSATCALVSPRAVLGVPLGIGVVLGGGAILALGYGFGPADFVAALPLVRNIHHVWDAFLAASIPELLVVSGIGIAAVLGTTARRDAIARSVAVMIAGVLLVRMVPGDWSGAAARLGLASVVGPMLLLIGLGFAHSRWPRAALVSVGLIAGLLPGGLHVSTGIAELDALLLQPGPRVQLDAPSPAVAVLQDRMANDQPFRVVGVSATLFPGTQALYGLESTGSPDALRVNSSESIADLAGVTRTSWIWRFELRPGHSEATKKYLDLVNVRYLLARLDHVLPGSAVLDIPYGDDPLRIVERPTAWPRAFFAPAVTRHHGADGFLALLERSTGPFASVDERDGEAIARVEALPRAGEATPAKDYRLTPNTTAFRVTAASAGIAVLSESYLDRDFRVTLNGQPAPYIRVNHAFKGVPIPGPGEWDVRFEYRPALWEWSWVLAGLGLAGLAGLAVFCWRGKPSDAPSL